MNALDQLMIWCGYVSIVGGALAVIMKVIRPILKMNARVEELEQHDKKDYETLARMEKQLNTILRSQVAIIDNRLTGNCVENLKTVKEDINDCIFNEK